MQIKNILRGLLPLVALATLVPVGAAQSQNDLTTPTGWRWRRNVPLSTIQDDISDGYRLVDIEVEDDSPLRFSASFVRNTGDYQKNWWWYYGQTASQVTSRFGQHGARLVDVEPYQTANGIRYAVLFIANTGDDRATSHGWLTGRTFQNVTDWLSDFPNRRILDIQPYRNSGGDLRYAYTWVANTGNTFQASTGVWLNTTLDFVQTQLSGRRIVDLEVEDDTGRLSVLTAPSDGEPWYWYVGMEGSQVEDFVLQRACRLTDIQRYRTPGGSIRYAVVCRPNDNDLTVLATTRMRSHLPNFAESGLLLREFNGATSTLAGTFESRTFEPASLMKTAHHFTAMRRVNLGLDDLSNPVTEFTGLNGSCPTGTNPQTRSLSAVLERMMESSSNTATQAIEDRYGVLAIEANSAAFGAPGVELNHTLGCLCSQQENEATLLDFAGLHESVVAGALGDERDDFYELMLNGTNFGRGAYSTTDVLDQELASSNLSASEEFSFRRSLRVAYKGGSYSCSSPGTSIRHRSTGAYVQIPFRNGCQLDLREYFIGAWVNFGTDSDDSNDAVGRAVSTLFRDRIRAAIESWEDADCEAFEIYCNSTQNSTGFTALTGATGSQFLQDDDFTVLGLRMPPNQFASLILSRTAGFTPFAGGSSGNLCLGGSIVRYPGSVGSTGPNGARSLDFNLPFIPSNSGGFELVERGDTLHLQWWVRDVEPNGGATSNFSSGLRVTFL